MEENNDPVAAVKALAVELAVAQGEVVAAFAHVREVKSRIAAVKRTLREALSRKKKAAARPPRPSRRKRGLPKAEPVVEG